MVSLVDIPICCPMCQEPFVMPSRGCSWVPTPCHRWSMCWGIPEVMCDPDPNSQVIVIGDDGNSWLWAPVLRNANLKKRWSKCNEHVHVPRLLRPLVVTSFPKCLDGGWWQQTFNLPKCPAGLTWFLYCSTLEKRWTWTSYFHAVFDPGAPS